MGLEIARRPISDLYQRSFSSIFAVMVINKFGMEDHKVYKISQQLGIYRGQNIDRGSYGDVYKGFDQLHNRQVALKHIKDKYWQDEVATMRALNHPNIVRYYGHVPNNQIEAQKNGEGAYIIMEYVDGRTLRDLLQQKNFGGVGLPESMVVKLFGQLIDGFSYMHHKGIVHRDIKPENILVDESLNVKIIDLGQSKQRVLMQTINQGTPLYNAPQVFTDQNPKDFRRDVWSLGLVLYEMLTGHFFFEKFLEEHKNDMSVVTLKNYVLNRKMHVKLSKKLDPFWEELLNDMVRKNYKNRKHMHEIQLMFHNQYDRLSKRIQSKILWKTVRQIKPLFLETDLLAETQPMKVSQHHAAVSKARRYLRFFFQKNRVLVMLGQLFSLRKYPCRYPFMPRVLKTAIIFLCYEIYLSSIKSIVSDLKNNVVKISPKEKYSVFDFEEPYKGQLQKQILHYLKFYQQEVTIFEAKILQNILPSFKKHFFYKQIPIIKKKQSNSSVKKTLSIKFQNQEKADSKIQIKETIQRMTESGKQLVQNHQKYTFTVFDDFPTLQEMLMSYESKTKLGREKYMHLFKGLIESKHVFQTDQNLQNYFYSGDLAIYLLMKIIANLDDHYKWEQVDKGSEIMQKDNECIQSLENKGMKSQFLKKIQSFNRPVFHEN